MVKRGRQAAGGTRENPVRLYRCGTCDNDSSKPFGSLYSQEEIKAHGMNVHSGQTLRTR